MHADTHRASLLWDRYCLMPHKRIFFWQLLWSDMVPESHPSCTRSSAVVQSHYHLQAGGIEQRITPATVKYCLTLTHYPKAPLFTSQPCIHHFQILEQLCCLSVHTHSMCGCCMLATTFFPAVCIHTLYFVYHFAKCISTERRELHMYSNWISILTPFFF